ncbi:MAG TPA: hypothetical protein VGI49_19035 [Mycobacterium sp.]
MYREFRPDPKLRPFVECGWLRSGSATPFDTGDARRLRGRVRDRKRRSHGWSAAAAKGTYPASVVPIAFAFEHYVHIRCDLLSPGGPLSAEPPASDELRLAPTLDWIEAALPQPNAKLLDGMDKAVEVRVTGVSGRTLRIGNGDVPAQITRDSTAFIRWITQRGSWEALGVDAHGDPSALDVVRRLTVF